MTARALFLAAALTLALTHAADPLPDTFKAYQERYQKLKAEIDAERDKSVDRAIADYRAELTTLLANVRQRGDLDYVVAIQNELKRTETDRSAPANPADKEMKQLRAAQWGARKIEDKANERYGERLDKLNSSYVRMLEALEKRLVAANQIDDAKLARDEQERIAAEEAICGEWLWLGQYRRTARIDGFIREEGTDGPIGAWEFLGNSDDGLRQFGVSFYGGKYAYTVTMSEDGSQLTWQTKPGGKSLSAKRMK